MWIREFVLNSFLLKRFRLTTSLGDTAVVIVTLTDRTTPRTSRYQPTHTNDCGPTC